ncbi:MAG: type II secretion system protein [Verrucomicrobiales bacterium]
MRNTNSASIQKKDRGFSLVEVLASVSIIGVITFLALPNIMTVRRGAEENLAITRAEAINMATAAFIQSRGRANAEGLWFAASTDEQRYSLLAPFLAFAPASVADFMPSDYHLTYPATLSSLTKIPLRYDTDLSNTSTGWAIGY